MSRKSYADKGTVKRVVYAASRKQRKIMEELKKQFGIATNQALVDSSLLLFNSVAVEIRKGRKVAFVEEGKIKGELIIPIY